MTPVTAAPVIVAAVQAAPVLLDREATIAKVVTLAEKAAADGRPPGGVSRGVRARLSRLGVADPAVGRRGHRPVRQAPGPGRGGRIRRPPTCSPRPPGGCGSGCRSASTSATRTDSTIYNSLLHFAPDGSLAARHRKLMPTGGERLVWGMGDGSTLKVIDTGFGRLGGLICWENYMPLARAALYAQGVDVYLAPTWDNSEVWVPTLRHIAREGRTYVIGVTSCIRAADLPADLPGRAACTAARTTGCPAATPRSSAPTGRCWPARWSARKACCAPRSTRGERGPAASSSIRSATTAARTSSACSSTPPPRPAVSSRRAAAVAEGASAELAVRTHEPKEA